MLNVLLISTYELGRQPFGLASPAAWLRRAGAAVSCVDLSRERLPAAEVQSADVIGFFLPMHTAARLALPVLRHVRALNPAAHVCCYGLYAWLNKPLLETLGVKTVIGGEYEDELVSVLDSLRFNRERRTPSTSLPRLSFVVPDRAGLLPLSKYAAVRMPDGSQRTVGYTEASRGCKHGCLHCPIVPVYDGQFRIVPPDVVLADISAQVDQGAQHITFGDPDFFNGIGHALKVINAVAREFPGLTYDVTIKVEHLLQYQGHLDRLRDTGCLFVTSAVESIDDRVLAILAKGHTRDDFVRVASHCRAIGLVLSPTFVPFTPWTTVQGYCALLATIAQLELTEQVAPIQLAIRLLLPEGSRLLGRDDIRAVTGPFEPERLVYPWTHPDPRVDALQCEVSALVGERVDMDMPRDAVFDAVAVAAHRCAGIEMPSGLQKRPHRAHAVPHLNEPWYRCAEPTDQQLAPF